MWGKKLTAENLKEYQLWAKKNLVLLDESPISIDYVIQELGFIDAASTCSIWSNDRKKLAVAEWARQYAAAGFPDAEKIVQTSFFDYYKDVILSEDIHSTAPEILYKKLNHLPALVLYRYAKRSPDAADRVRTLVNIDKPLFKELFFKEESLSEKLTRYWDKMSTTPNYENTILDDFVVEAKKNPELTYSLCTESHIKSFVRNGSMSVLNKLGMLLQGVFTHHPAMADIYYKELMNSGAFYIEYALVNNDMGKQYIASYAKKESIYIRPEVYLKLWSIWKKDISLFDIYILNIHMTFDLKQSLKIVDMSLQYETPIPSFCNVELPDPIMFIFIKNQLGEYNDKQTADNLLNTALLSKNHQQHLNKEGPFSGYCGEKNFRSTEKSLGVKRMKALLNYNLSLHDMLHDFSLMKHINDNFLNYLTRNKSIHPIYIEMIKPLLKDKDIKEEFELLF